MVVLDADQMLHMRPFLSVPAGVVVLFVARCSTIAFRDFVNTTFPSL